MKKIVNERLLFLIVFLLMIIMVINASQKERKYHVFNHKTGKIYKYHHLKPGEKIFWSIDAPDSITVITRLVIKAAPDSQYSYQIAFDGAERTVTRNLVQSSVSRGLNGDKVSSWNSFRGRVYDSQRRIMVHNTTRCEMLVKFKADSARSGRSHKTKSEYLAYPPDYYDQSIPVMINDKVYTYYQGKDNGIALILEGPLKLKVINRLIIDEVENLSFSWKALLDNQEILYVSESLPYSESCLADSSSQVTQGLVNILEIPKGIHEIKLEDEFPQGIIYRLYISKSAVGN